MLELKSESKDYGINLPTNINELTPEVLGAITDNVQLAPYYAIVALCFQVKLMDIAVNVNNDKEQTMSIVPVLAKISEEDSDRINAVVGNRLVLDRSTIERGIHLNIPTMISSKNVATYIKQDEVLRNNLVNGGDGSPESALFIEGKSVKERDEIKLNKSPQVYILEFKVVAVNDINVSIASGSKIIDPFKTTPKLLVS